MHVTELVTLYQPLTRRRYLFTVCPSSPDSYPRVFVRSYPSKNMTFERLMHFAQDEGNYAGAKIKKVWEPKRSIAIFGPSNTRLLNLKSKGMLVDDEGEFFQYESFDPRETHRAEVRLVDNMSPLLASELPSIEVYADDEGGLMLYPKRLRRYVSPPPIAHSHGGHNSARLVWTGNYPYCS